jgi:hypothetical protein
VQSSVVSAEKFAPVPDFRHDSYADAFEHPQREAARRVL